MALPYVVGVKKRNDTRISFDHHRRDKAGFIRQMFTYIPEPSCTPPSTPGRDKKHERPVMTTAVYG
ncbi:hypothetical protein M413DRAFT_450016 [Hebeloma cylindrosporum]|uniref:Uncharacterized protein n=1 Tax=Hebeloma cylindrosporum TaxID=76867 RepID=A0A0C3BDH6_HEBCY|nr:hypothetical protein M413DRAFT_450016 [Hebeloma cylindrosporum h7]